MDPAGFDRLLSRARRRDQQALHELVDLYGARIYGLQYRLTGSRETAEDLTQETFLRVVRTIGDYRHDGRFESWLFRIAANLARDHARKQNRRGRDRSGEQIAFEVEDASQPGPEQRMIGKEAGERLAAGLKRLPELDREIIMLRHFSELPFRDIAAMLDIPLGTALARAHRAMKRLREALGAETE